MKTLKAIQVMSAFLKPTRWKAFWLLVERLPARLATEEIAGAVGISRKTMSLELTILSHAGLISSTRIGRKMLYKADINTVRELSEFLAKSSDI